MPKINQEEYEVLKALDSRAKSIVRQDRGWLWVAEQPMMKDRTGWYVSDGFDEVLKDDNLFQFIQWEDEKPHNISELIEEYEIENGMRYDFGKIKVVDIDTSKLATHNGYIYVKESEETEVKKDKLWAKIKVQEELESWLGVEGGIGRDEIKYVLNIIDQLDEPEVFSQEEIDNGMVHIRNLGDTFEVEAVDSLLVPNQELPVIPKNVADWITNHREKYDLYPALRTLENNTLVWGRIYEWYRMNTHKFVNAYLTGEYEVEEEQLYYALIKGHELITDKGVSTCKYWNFNTYNSDVFPNNRLSKHGIYLTEMSKKDWNKLGINDSNADFVKVKETE